MKYSELMAELKAAGCYFSKHGGNHDMCSVLSPEGNFQYQDTKIMKFLTVLFLIISL